MGKGLLGKKIGMTQVFGENGEVMPVTVIEAGPCVVIQKKSADTDGYSAVQLGFDDKNSKRIKKPMKGHFDKAGVTPKRFVREIRSNEAEEYEVGQTLNADVFAEGDLVDITGVSKGKGFTGVIRRHNFSRGPMAHGSMYHRRTGSLGSTDPARVFKGRKMPGHMGDEVVTIRGLSVVRVDPDKNLLLVKGSVPGRKDGFVVINSSSKATANR